MLIDEITFIFNGLSLTLVIDVDSMGRSDDTLIYYALVTKMLPVSADVTIVLQSILNLNSNKSESKLISLESFTLCDRCDGNKTLAPTGQSSNPFKSDYNSEERACGRLDSVDGYWRIEPIDPIRYLARARRKISRSERPGLGLRRASTCAR